MISGISKKVIFFSFLFINFIQPSKSAELSKINKNINNQNTKFLWLNTINEKILSSNSETFNDKNSFVNPLENEINPDATNTTRMNQSAKFNPRASTLIFPHFETLIIS